jgi:hypothetical protein
LLSTAATALALALTLALTLPARPGLALTGLLLFLRLDLLPLLGLGPEQRRGYHHSNQRQH